MKFIHSADIHLDSPFTLASPAEARARRTELRAAFSSAVLFAKTEGCELFLIAGDLFDDNFVTKDTVEHVYREIAGFPACQFVIAPGNHDYYYPKSPYALTSAPSNLHIFTASELSYIDLADTNVRVYGYAFTADTMTDSPLAGFEVHDRSKINILIAHGDVASSASLYCPLRESELEKSGFDYVALGHIHKTSGVKYAGRTAYAYPGCLEGRGFDETGYKGALYGEIGKDSLSVKPIRFSKRRYEIACVDVTAAATLTGAADKILEACAGYGEDTALRLILEGVTAPSFSAEETVLRSLLPKPYYLEVQDKTLPLYRSELLGADGTLVGEFYRKLEDKLASDDEKIRTTAQTALKYGLKALLKQ